MSDQPADPGGTALLRLGRSMDPSLRVLGAREAAGPWVICYPRCASSIWH